MVEADIPQAFPLLAAYLTKFQLAQKYTAEEFKHWLLTRKGVVYSFVIEVRHRATVPMSLRLEGGKLIFVCLAAGVGSCHKANHRPV